MKYYFILFFILSAFLLTGCASTSAAKFSRLQMGMTKEEVRKILGNPSLFRASMDNQETWEYTVYAPHLEPITGLAPMWVSFIDGKLTFYGHPGDYGSSIPKTEKHEIIIKNQ